MISTNFVIICADQLMRDDMQKIRFKQNGSNLTSRRHLKTNTESCSWTDFFLSPKLKKRRRKKRKKQMKGKKRKDLMAGSQEMNWSCWRLG